MEKQLIQQTITDALLKISFTERYKGLSEQFNERNYDLLMKPDKKEVLRLLEEIGYEFIYFKISKDYVYKVTNGDYSFQINMNVKDGICTQYLGILYQGSYIEYESNFAFIYRHLLNDINAEITSPKFSSYEQFKAIVIEILGIFEDFQREFIALVEKV